jgi:hypothetical protein
MKKKNAATNSKSNGTTATSKKRRGNCYVTCEALYHLLGGKAAGWEAHHVKHEGDTHWWLERWTYEPQLGCQFITRLDPTVSQFKTKPPYEKGRCGGFLTIEPSRRAKALMDKMVWQ